MTKSNQGMGAWDLMKRLQSDPKWIAQNAAREERRARAEAQLLIEEGALISDLAAAGFEVTSVWDLVNSKSRYPEAVSILIDHLHRSYPMRIREGIIRALTVEDAKGRAANVILAQLKTETDGTNRWALANALTVVGELENRDDIADLLRNPDFADVSERLSKAFENLSD